MFWDIADEGKIPQSEKEPFYMAKILNSIL